MSTPRLRTVALLASEPGLALLDVLLRRPDLELKAVVTHLHRPRSEGGVVRPEVVAFRRICLEAGVPLVMSDAPAAQDVGPDLPIGELDLLISASWRFLVGRPVLDRFSLGGINLHRGELPKHAGAFPVRQAIEAGERRFAITAHEMTDRIGEGRILAQAWLDMEPPPGVSAGMHADTVKAALVPLYGPLAGRSIEAVTAREPVGS